MVARAVNTADLVIELLREGRLIDKEVCRTPPGCAQKATLLIARQGTLEAGDIILVRDEA
jgi:hypothetical protein